MELHLNVEGWCLFPVILRAPNIIPLIFFFFTDSGDDEESMLLDGEGSESEDKWEELTDDQLDTEAS